MAQGSALCLTHGFFHWRQTPEELDDSDFETEDFDVRSRTSVQTEDDQLIAGQSARVRSTLKLLFCRLSLEKHCAFRALFSSLSLWPQD